MCAIQIVTHLNNGSFFKRAIESVWNLDVEGANDEAHHDRPADHALRGKWEGEEIRHAGGCVPCVRVRVKPWAGEDNTRLLQQEKLAKRTSKKLLPSK